MKVWWLLVLLSTFASSLVAPPPKASGRLSGRRNIAIRTTLELPNGGGLVVPRGRCTVASFWGVAGVMAMLVNAVKRVLPVAIEPFQSGLSPPLWAAYGIFALGMCYAEGYKAFHLKFSPLVVARSMTLGKAGAPFYHYLLAPVYAMGLFHANGKRTKTSWGFIVGIFALVKLVKKLDYPWRAIVDGGVVVGLSVGTFSIAYHYFREVFLGIPAPADPELPLKSSSA